MPHHHVAMSKVCVAPGLSPASGPYELEIMTYTFAAAIPFLRNTDHRSPITEHERLETTQW